MGQQDVYNLLRKKKRWMSSKEISKILDISSSSRSLKKLYKYGEIIRRPAKNEFRHFIYEYKIK